MLISVVQLCLMLAILGLPTVSPGAADLLRLARLDCTAEAPSSPMPSAGSPLDLEVHRTLLLTDSEGPSAVYPPSPPIHPPLPLQRLSPPPSRAAFRARQTEAGAASATSFSADHSPSQLPPTMVIGGASALLSTPPTLSQRLGSSGLGLLTLSGSGHGGVAGQLLTNLQLHGQLDLDDMVLGILVACLVLFVIATLGLTMACSRARSCAHRLASTLYFVAGLPVWAALSFVVIYCFVFRAEAEALVRRYWACLLLTEPEHKDSATHTAWGAAAAVYQSITLTATLLLACNVLVLAGLLSAGHVVGWAAIASNLLNVINGGLLLAGGGLVAVAAGLHERAEGSVHADAAMVALGAGVLAVSTVGLLGSRLHSACLLRLYTICSLLVTLALGAFVGGLSVLGVQGLADSTFISNNWHYVSDIYPIQKHEFLQLLGRHWTKLMIASALLLFVQLLVVIASCILRRSIAPGLPEPATQSEQAGLMDDDDDDGGIV